MDIHPLDQVKTQTNTDSMYEGNDFDFYSDQP
jgi:hypothetical protein